MYSSMWFMSVVVLLVTDVRTGALQEGDIQPSRCYSCRANGTTSCEQSSGWASVTCPTKRPLCATAASGPDFRSSLICAPVTKKPCSVRTPTNTSIVVTCVCHSNLCNAPFSVEWRNELQNYISNATDVRQLNVCELLSKFKNDTDEEHLYKAITTEVTEASTTIAKSSSQPITLGSVPSTMDIHTILRDSERPRAEALKQDPTVPSDDDEDESEGSGSYEESRIHNHAVSAPAAPSSFLPANENSASSLYKDLLVTTLFIYFVV
ncbi:uncharacterized protein LOC142982176 [Anticarsia gemmatalis]|uniref:uncharacterized protein LOC142982176 n=1 Tax=Anticarsia gemmatalis TaxID=129554 RepID=UPI003F775961